MKILFITDNFPPEVNAPAARTYDHCREWVKLGADITVITCVPNFPNGKVYPGYKNSLIKKERVEGIEVIRVWSYITANQGFAKRILDYFSFAVSSFLVGFFKRTDIIIATSPQFFTTWSAYALSLLKRKPWVFELRDLWPESIKTVGALKQGKVIEILEKIELFLYRRATAVVAVTPAFKRNLVHRGIAAEKINVIPNGTNLDLFVKSEKNEQLLSKLGLSDKFVIAYIGTHGMAHGLDFIVRCAAELENRPEVHFLFIGDGAEKTKVLALAKELDVKNCTFLDPIPKNEVPAYLSLADVSLIPLRKSETFKTVIPSKIFEAAGMGKPILLGVEGQAKEIVDQYHAGICFKPEDSASFVEAVSSIANNKEIYTSLQKGCAELAQEYDRTKLAGEMLHILKTKTLTHESA